MVPGFLRAGLGGNPISPSHCVMRAVRSDHYIVNGQKIWTTNAHFADWIFLPGAHLERGQAPGGHLPFLLIDMKSPGIKIDPIYLVDGTRTPMRHEVNQVFFTDVEVPVENGSARRTRAGPTPSTCSSSRARGQAHGPRLRKAFRHLQTLSKSSDGRRRALSASPGVAREDGGARMEIDAVEMNEMMFYSSLKTGDAPGNMASVVKMRGTRSARR